MSRFAVPVRRSCSACSPRPRLALALALLAAPPSVIVGCDAQEPPSTEPAPPASPPTVSVIEAHADGWTETFAAYGVVEPATSVVITAPLSGRVATVLVVQGEAVAAGQPLLRFDEGTRRTQLSKAKAAASAAKKAVADARREADEKRTLGRTGTLPRAEVDAADIALRQAVERYEDTRTSVRLASRDVADMKIASPVAGTVTARSIEPGEAVSAGREFFTIATTDRLRVKVFVSEVYVNALVLGATAPVTVNGVRGRTLTGRVESIALRADDSTGNFEVMVALDDPSGLVRPGMTARAELTSQSDDDAVVIPRSAVADRDRRRLVFVERDGVAKALHPVLGIGSDTHIPVLEGIEAGDRVIIDGLAFVQDGVAVNSTVAELPAPRPATDPPPGSGPTPTESDASDSGPSNLDTE